MNKFRDGFGAVIDSFKSSFFAPEKYINRQRGGRLGIVAILDFISATRYKKSTYRNQADFYKSIFLFLI